MDIRKIKKLIEMLEASDIDEIEIHEGEESVRISRASSIQSPPVQQPLQQLIVPAATAPAPGPTTGPLPGSAPLSTPAPDIQAGEIVRSPMIGTFYSSPSPEAPPFVTVGTEVSQGDVLCIIEAMKIMNQIESPYSGTVVQIMAESGAPIEFDQSLFVIRT